MSKELAGSVDFSKRAEGIKEKFTKSEGKVPAKKEDRETLRSAILNDMEFANKQLNFIRKGDPKRRPANISLGQFVKERWGFAVDDDGNMNSFFKFLGLNPSADTLSYLVSVTDHNEGFKWLIPEVIREAIRLGLRKAPLWPQLVADEIFVEQPKITMPYINPSDAVPTKIGEAETIPTGKLSFGQRDITLQKVGVGLRITDEVQRYVKLNQLGIYFQDMGVKLNMAQDVMAIDVLINGDGNGNAAPIIGVDNVGTIEYRDLLRAWIRMGLLGRLPQSMLSNEEIALDVLTLPEFTNNTLLLAGIESKLKNINLRTPVPTNQAYDVHGAMPVANQLMLIDGSSALVKFTSDALRIENDRIVEKQIDGAFATLTTGFASLFRDARLIIDKSLDIQAVGFPDFMNAGAVQAAAGLRTL